MNKITTTNEIDHTKATTIYDFIAKDTYQMDVPLGEFCRGMVTLIVNIGSACGLTAANYAQLTQINKDFDGSKIRIRIIWFLISSFDFAMFIISRDSYSNIPIQSIYESDARR